MMHKLSKLIAGGLAALTSEITADRARAPVKSRRTPRPIVGRVHE